MSAPPPIRAVLFDKDGTLFDFHATWNVWAGALIEDLAEGSEARRQALARETRYDLEAQAFFPDSPVIAGTNREAAECIARARPDRSVEAWEEHLMHSSAAAPLAEAVPLAAFLDGLSARGLKLGVMTNDTEFGARAHLGTARVAERFDFICGFDSGHGAKPDAAPLLAFARAVGVPPEACVMVGDSSHDMVAGRAAGMRCVAVLTGMAGQAELARCAEVVLPDIGHLPAWLDAQGAGAAPG